jgi:phage terminase large subunit-like protein
MARKIKRSERNIKWIQSFCRVPEGKLIGQKVELRPWQKRELRKIYDNPHVTRRAIISFGRKNGKTALAAFLLLLHLCGPEKVPNSQLYSAAQSRDQAARVFDLAAKIVRMSPALQGVVNVRDTAKELECADLGTRYKALSAEASTAYGLSPVFIVHDELGQVKGDRSELYEALETATGAQEHPLSVIISTQAPTNSDLLSILIDDALAGHDPCTVVSLYTAPMDDDPFIKETIKLANPAYGDFLNAKEVMMMADKAKRMRSEEASYRNLVLNQRVEAKSPFVSRAAWLDCGAEPKSISEIPSWAGLDLSSAVDLTAFVRIGKVDDIWQVHSTFWLPGDGLEDKARHDRVPYDVWAKQDERGRIFLNTAPGKSVDYEYVANHIAEVFATTDLQKVAFDRWGMHHLTPWLLRAGLSEEFIAERFVEFGQGTQSMTPALRVLESEIMNQRLAHGNHPVLRMCAANAVVIGQDDSCRKLSKAKSNGRIDGMVALTMAFGVTPIDVEEPEYQMIIL